MLYSFESCLKTTDAKNMAIELLKEQVEKWKEKYKKQSSYENEAQINRLVECIVQIYFELCEVQNGIKYFHKQYIEKDKEIKEYILLDMLEEANLYKEWVLEYESQEKRVDYRESLREKYKEYKALY